MECGCSDDTSSGTVGLDKNKQRCIANGATLNFLTSAMMETEDMRTTYPAGDNKTGDRYNAGAAKQNWFMIGSSRNPAFPNGGNGPSHYQNVVRLNWDKKLDVQSYLASLSRYGLNNLLAGHRNGSSGIKNPNTYDIKRFGAAFHWTRDRIASNPGLPHQPGTLLGRDTGHLQRPEPGFAGDALGCAHRHQARGPFG